MALASRRNFLKRVGAGLVVASSTRPLWSANWVDVRQVGPFVIRGDFPLESHEQDFADLPELQTEVQRVLGIRAPRHPIEVLLLDDRIKFRTHLKENHPGVPYRRALFIKRGNNAQVLAFRQPELAIDLRHECTHALLHSRMGLLPLWLDEGLAEYFEMPAEERAFGHPHLNALRWNMRLGMVRDIAVLEENHDLEEMGGGDYRFSWAWVHFMLHGPEAAYRTLLSFLGNCQRGVAPGLLSEHLEQALPGATDRMISHFKQWPTRNPA